MAYSWRKVDLFDKDATPEFGAAYLEANPNPLCSSKVPVLEVTSADQASPLVFTESRVVLDAVEELWPAADGHPALLPAGVLERARVRVFGEAAFEGAFGGERSAYKTAIRKLDADAGQGQWDPAAERAKLCQSLAALDACLDGSGPFLLGDQFSMAEVMVAPFMQVVRVLSLTHTPALFGHSCLGFCLCP